MFRNTKQKLAVLLSVILIVLSLPAETVMAVENVDPSVTNETIVTTDDLLTEENTEVETPAPTATSVPVQDETEMETPVPIATEGPVEDELLEDKEKVPQESAPIATNVPAEDSAAGEEENVKATPMPTDTEELMDAEEIAEVIYAQITADDFEVLVLNVESAWTEDDENLSEKQGKEQLLSLVEKEVAACLADILEKAKTDYAQLEEEEIYQAVYNSLYEKVLSNIKELLGLNQETENDDAGLYSLLPLKEKRLTPDLTGLTPVELTMVPFSKIFQGEDMTGVDQIAYVFHQNNDSDDYIIGDYQGSADLSWGTIYNYDPWLMIPRSEQLDSDAVRYVVKPQYTNSRNWLMPTIYSQDGEGNRTAEVLSSYYYFDSGHSVDGNPVRGIYIDISTEKSSAALYLKLDINDSLYGESTNRSKIRVYEGYCSTAEKAQMGNDITDKICGNIDMLQADAGYCISDYSNRNITIVSYDTNGNVTGCLPLRLWIDLDIKSTSNHIERVNLFRKTAYGIENVSYNSMSQRTEDNIEIWIYELYDKYAINDIYNFRMNYYERDTENNNAVTAAYCGNYASITEAVNAGAEDIKEALFGTDGYGADYSNGVYFSIFVGNDGEGQEAYHYCIKTKAGIVPKSNSVGVRFTGLKDQNRNDVACYIVKSKDDSYGDGSYPTIMVADNVDLTQLAPVFHADSGVNLYSEGGNVPEISGESYHDFSDGAVAYTTGSESKKNQRNVWLSVIKPSSVDGMSYNLYTNSLSDKEANTRVENGVIYSKREVILEDSNDGHDIFLINMGANVIPSLSVEVASDTLQIDEYWTLNGNHDLSAFSGTMSTTNYGELANMAKVRLKMKDGVTSGEAVNGTFTVKANGTTIMVLELTGIAGAPVIVTDSIPEAVKYVPYGTMIQNSNKYSKTQIKYELAYGALPEGMELMENGELYGVPKQAGTFNFGVRMASTNPNSNMTKGFTLVVKENTDANVDAATDTGYDVTQRIPTVAIGSTDSHTFVSQGVLDEFIDVYLDGEKLTKDVDYVAESGSTRLTISSQTLTRDNTTGTHTLGVEFRTSEENVLKAAAQNFNVVGAGSSTGGSSSSGDSGSSSGNNDSSDSTSTENGNSDSSVTNNILLGVAGMVATGAASESEAAQNVSPAVHTVVSGDTLSKIALQYYGDSSLWTKIYEDNRDIISNPNMIRVGWQIKIYPLEAGNATGTAQALNQADTDQANAGQANTDSSAVRTYVVQSGDTLWKISKAMYGRGWQWRRIYDANKDSIPNPGVIRVGQVLVIP